MNHYGETLPALKSSLPGIIEAYELTREEISRAFAAIETARRRVPQALSPGTEETIDLGQHANRLDVDECLKRLRRGTWQAIVHRTGVQAMMSERRRKELESQLEEREHPLPEVTEQHVVAMLKSTLGSTADFLAEAVQEVYRFLRPQSTWNPLKTNEKNKWKLGDKVILSYAIERGYHPDRPFRVSHHRNNELTALDNVFALLDGRGPVKSHYGPLVDAIHASPDGTGKTDMFAFKCFANRNLHLQLLRPDLVDKLNLIAGGANLPDAH